MNKLFIFVMLGFGITTPFLFSSNISEAVCAEVVVKDENGNFRTFNTFGEGTCPAGSKKLNSSSLNCSSGSKQSSFDCANQRLENINDVFDSARSALTDWGDKNFLKIYNNDFKIVSNIDIDILEDYKIEDGDRYTQTTFTQPKLGEVISLNAGMSILSLKTGYFSECLVPLFNYSKTSFVGGKFNIYKNAAGCKAEKKKDEYFDTSHFNVFFPGKPPMKYNFELKKKEKKGITNFTLCLAYPWQSGACVKKKKAEDFIFADGFVSDSRLSKLGIIFLGKSGDILNFKIVANDDVQDFTLNLTKSNILEFQGAKIEIMNSDESELTYKVLSYFE